MNIVIIGATSGIGKTLFLKYAHEDKPLQEDCEVNQWHQPTVQLKPIKSTIWKHYAKRLSKVQDT